VIYDLLAGQQQLMMMSVEYLVGVLLVVEIPGHFGGI
jgi:hypothetical protein